MNNKFYTALYARTSDNKIKAWIIEVLPKDHTAYCSTDIRINHGELNGKMVERIDTITSGKNLGKSNETTPYEQALSEAKSRIEKKLKEGYKELDDLGYFNQNNSELHIESFLQKALPPYNTDSNNNIIPMKCQKFWKDDEETVPRITFPCLVQPKINGVRAFCLWENGKTVLRSKKGLEYTILNHITDHFKEDDFMYNGEPIIYDGELYIENTILSDIVSAVRVNSLLTASVKFYVFDLAVDKTKQEDRITMLCDLFDPDSSSLYSHSSVIFTETIPIQNVSEAIKWFNVFKDKGYEGAIYRNPNAEYAFGKRPQTIVKLKKYLEEEFRIIDVLPQEKAPYLGIFKCIHKEKTFLVNPEGSNELKHNYLVNKNQYIGKMLQTKFYEWTVNNLPFHAKGVAIRDYE